MLSMSTLRACAVVVLGALGTQGVLAGGGQTLIYETDFESGAGPEWSLSTTTTAPSGEKFLGQLENTTAVLSLTGLPAHESVTIEFDLYVINTMDGTEPFTFALDSAPFFVTTFSNASGTPQWFPSEISDGSQSPPQTGAEPDSDELLGYPPINGNDLANAVYRLSYTLPHTASSLQFAVTGAGRQGLADESWGIDNVRVFQAGAPAPVVVNGDFELSVPNSGSGNGWTASGGVDGAGGWRSTGGNPGGTYILNAGGSAGTDPTIAQNVSGFVIGGTYVVVGEYAVGNVGALGAPGALAVDVDGVELFLGSATGSTTNWVPFETEPFVATTETMEIRLRGEVNGSDNDPRVDNIQIVQTSNEIAGQKLFVIDFEGLSEEEAIDLQYAELGAFFSIDGSPDLPIIAVEGAPGVAFNTNDTPMSSGSGGLTDPLDGGSNSKGQPIAIDFDPPVSSVRFFVIDIDGGESYIATASLLGEQVASQTVTAGDVGTGNAISTEFFLSGEAIDRVVLSVPAMSDYAIDFVSFTRPCTGSDCGPLIEIAQESAPDAGDFDDNVLSVLLSQPFSGPATDFYAYDVPAGASWNGQSLKTIPERSHLLFADTVEGLTMFVVHDSPNNAGGGSANMSIEVFDDPDGVFYSFVDDPSEGSGCPPGSTSCTSVLAWSSCCTDGYALSGLDGGWSMLLDFDSFSSMNEWVAYSADGSQTPLALETNRRVRLRQLALPDLFPLQVASATAEVTATEPIELSWEVQNAGDIAATGVWMDRVYLSVDEVFDGGDIPLSDVQQLGPLAGGESYVRMASPVAPNAPGEYFLLLVTDADDQVDEGSGEMNNILASVQTITILPPPTPDLVVTAVEAPCTAAIGVPTSISYTIENQGNATASGTWSDRIVFSFDQVQGGDEVLLDQPFTGTIAPGESYTQTVAGVVPNGVPLVTGFVGVSADIGNAVDEGPTGEDNNFAFALESTILTDGETVNLLCWEEADYQGGSAGNWVVAPDGLSVEQLVNAQPTFFVSDFDLVGSQFQGTFRVNTASDDDYIGFTFGYQGLAADEGYYVFHWKQGTQNLPLLPGFQVLRIQGDVTASDIQLGGIADPVPKAIAVLAQETAPDNALGWQDFVTYRFFLTFQENGSIRIIIRRDDNDALVWDSGLLQDPNPLGAGKVGFFNSSQSNVQYAGFVTNELLPPTAEAGGPYALSIGAGSATLDATLSDDPDAIEEGLFNGITGVQWDLGNDGIDRDDENLTNPIETISLEQLAAKGLSVLSDVQVGLTVTDADGLTGADTAVVGYDSTPPVVSTGGPYAVVEPGQSLMLMGTADDPDLAFPVGEALQVEWDTAQAGSLAEIGDGFANAATEGVPYATLASVLPSADSTIWLNAGDLSGLLASESVAVSLATVDLQPSALGSPTQATAGSTITIPWTETNNGDFAAPAGRSGRVYLSNDATLSLPADQLLGTIAFDQPLAGGASVPVQIDVTLPLGISGPRFIIVVSDAFNDVFEPFGGEVNNDVAAPIEIALEPRVDLVGVTATPGTPEVVAGQGVSLTYSFQNDGNKVATTPWVDAVFLSDDMTIGANDTQLLLSPANAAPLNIGASYQRTVSLQIPQDFVGGSKFLLMRADNANAIIEINDGNNTLATAINVLPTPAPDLANVQITEAPSSAVFGEPISVEWSAGNVGTQVLDSVWSDVVALSLDTTLGPGDILLGTQTINVGPLEPNGAGYDASLTATPAVLPSTTAGQYFILVRADGGGSITESNETNNTASFGPIQIDLPPLPDLTVQNVVVPPSAAIAQSVSVTADVLNSGGAATDAGTSIDVLLYAQKQGGQRVLVGVQTISGGIAVGESVPVSFNVAVPELGGDQFTFEVCADGGEDVIEVNESNNCVLASPTQYLRADLTPLDATYPLTLTAGTSVTFEVEIENAGAATAQPNPSWFDAVYLSPDAQAGNDLLVGTAIRVAPVPAGSTYTASVTVAIPQNFVGEYTVVLGTDTTNTVPEVTGNLANFKALPTTVLVEQPPRPNLRAQSVLAPSTGLGGGPVLIEWETTNAGDAPTQGFWIDRVFASVDSTLGPGDIALGSLELIGGLTPGETIPRSLVVDLPIIPGEYFILVRADADNAIIEGFSGQENDNTAASPSPILAETFTASVTAQVIPPAGPGSTSTVELNGQAVIEGSTEPAANVPVEIRITNRGFVRKLSAEADENGQFVATFVPAPNESGFYEAGAGPSFQGILPVSATWELFGFTLDPKSGPNNTALSIPVFPGQQISEFVEVRNTGDNTVTGLEVQIAGGTGGLSVGANLPVEELGAFESAFVELSIAADSDTTGTFPITLSVSGDQAITRNGSYAAVVAEPQPVITGPPAAQLTGGTLAAGMLVGEISFVEFTFSNTGGGTTGPVEVQIPPAPWLSVVTDNPIDPLMPGESATVTLRLAPSADLPLGPYTGSIVVTDGQLGFVLPFEFTAISDGIGAIEVLATDEFSYYDVPGEPDPSTPNGPKVAFAEVKVRDLVTDELVALGFTDENGLVSFEGLEEKFYNIEVSAEDHGSFASAVQVKDGQTAFVEAFLPLQLVQYSWQVIPTEIEDVYNITIQAEFEAFVPAPVVVVEPTYVDLSELTGPVNQIEFTVTNYGLITAEDVALNLPTQVGGFEIIPLVDEIGDLPGGCTPGNPSGPCTVTVPVLVIQDPIANAGGCTTAAASVCYELQCGPASYEFCTGATLADQRGCGNGGGGIIFIPPGGGISNPGGGCTFCPPPAQYSPPNQPIIVQPVPCDECVQKCTLAGLGCIPGAGCPLGVGQCVGGIITDPLAGADNVLACSIAGLNCAVSLTPGLSQLSCLCSVATNCICLDFGGGGGGGGCNPPCSPGDAVAFVACALTGGLANGDEGLFTPEEQLFRESYVGYLSPMALYLHVVGSPAWLEWSNPAEAPIFNAWNDAFIAATDGDGEGGQTITAAEMADLMSLPTPSTVGASTAQGTIDRWNLSVSNWSEGILEGDPEEFITFELLANLWDRTVQAQQDAIDNGFDNYVDQMSYAADLLFTATTSTNQGTCASVVIEIGQQLTLTRSAFEATLTLENESDMSLDAVMVDIAIEDTAGNISNQLFGGADSPELTGISAIDGSDSLAPGGSASTSWTLIPKDEAAPEQITSYFVSGTLSYFFGGELVSIPLFPVPITVVPNPNLELKYFLETQIFSDDPFTPEVEPAVPFSLGLLVNNSGAGVANNLQIASSQPEIVENETGLVVDFDITGTRIGLDPIAPSLNVNFGDLAAGNTAVAQWILVSSIQGEFVSYSAEFEHVSELDDPELSLIESVNILGLTRVVLDDESELADDKPDFLTDDFPDIDDLADTVHLSNATTEPVTTITSAEVVGDAPNLTATVNADIPEGWFYLRLEDPFDGAFPLKAVTRSDGKPIVFEYNAWQTSRIIRELGEAEVAERLVHIFDRGGVGQYTLEFDPDGQPPSVDAFFAIADHQLEGLDEVAIELNTIGLVSDSRSDIQTIIISFDEPLDPATFTDASVFVEGLTSGDGPVVVPSLTTELRSGDRTGVITFVEPLPDLARYCVQLIGVADKAGNQLDGDDATLRFSALAGDATGDLRVNNTDVGGVVSLLGTDPIDPDNIFHVRSDINRDGKVDDTDVQLVLDLRGNTLGDISNPCIVIEGGLALIAKESRPGETTGTQHGASGLGFGETPLPAPGPGFEAVVPSDEPLPSDGPGDGFEPDGLADSSLTAHTDASSDIVGIVALEPDQPLGISGSRVAVSVLNPDLTPELDVLELLAAYGFAPQAIEAAAVPGWTLATLPEPLWSPSDRASLAEALLRQGVLMSPLLIDSANAGYSPTQAIAVITRSAIPADWMDTVFERELPPGAVVSGPAIDTNAGTAVYEIVLPGSTGKVALDTALHLRERREVESSMPILAGSMFEPAAGASKGTPIAGDLDGDHDVDSDDMRLLINFIGSEIAPGSRHPADINSDGIVDDSDLILLMDQIGGGH